MNKEISYTKSVGAKHIRTYGQYFTQYKVADFMCAWAGRNAITMLDPAAGNSIFLTYVKKYNPQCILTGYEIDSTILNYFGNPSSAKLINDDYLLNDWDSKYDAIICNPPYNRFQAIENRDDIIDSIYEHTGVRYSGYTNLYILFLIKSIFQLSETGRLAYIIPSEFLNSKYGTDVKKLLIEKKLLRAIINFENDNEMFFNATTTCCILLLDNEDKKYADFYNLTSVEQLKLEMFQDTIVPSVRVEYCQLSAADKWRSYLNQETPVEYEHLKPISQFCSISRGIATGANDFFCFSLQKAKEYNIPESYLSKCICHSADVKSPIFSDTDYEDLSNSGKTVYLLDVSSKDYDAIKSYIKMGEANGINKKYLPSCRKPWYSMEQKTAAPIWVSSACRENIKFVRNLALTKSLTTFHSVFVNAEYKDSTDLIFCYFLTPIAQTIIRENRKELGGGLIKFQPNDLNTANMLDLNIISTKDILRVSEIYQTMTVHYSYTLVEQLNAIFSEYLLS